MEERSLQFWFEFASPYSYVAAMRIERLCENAGVRLFWKPFQLGPIFAQQGWNTSPFVLNPQRGAYMWRDMERLAEKFRLPWQRPSSFPRRSVLPARIAAAYAGAPWIGQYIRSIFVANFGEDRDIDDELVVAEALDLAGVNPDLALSEATQPPLRSRLRENTIEALALGIFGAPTCIVDGEVFWGEETLEDAIDWTGARDASGSVGKDPANTR